MPARAFSLSMTCANYYQKCLLYTPINNKSNHFSSSANIQWRYFTLWFMICFIILNFRKFIFIFVLLLLASRYLLLGLPLAPTQNGRLFILALFNLCQTVSLLLYICISTQNLSFLLTFLVFAYFFSDHHLCCMCWFKDTCVCMYCPALKLHWCEFIGGILLNL